VIFDLIAHVKTSFLDLCFFVPLLFPILYLFDMSISSLHIRDRVRTGCGQINQRVHDGYSHIHERVHNGYEHARTGYEHARVGYTNGYSRAISFYLDHYETIHYFRESIKDVIHFFEVFKIF
jgi:hypothetical protein